MLTDRTAHAGSSRTVGTLVVLGDSVGVGLGDPVAGRGWRGFAPLLAEALVPERFINLSVNGARLGSVRRDQLPVALRHRPDVAIVVAGMNDTMRSDFDSNRLHADLDRIVAGLTEAGALVLTIRYHDHGKVFRLPRALHRILLARISELNAVFDVVTRRHNTPVVDLAEQPGIYAKSAWAVDRLHPSELGHRVLARAFAERVAEAGLVAGDVSLACSGGLDVTRTQRVLWLIAKGIPWLLRRGTDLVPHLVVTMARAAFADQIAAGRAIWEDEPEPAGTITEQA
ncbi:MAG TPA: SGNH/GDSL hydrolase family protein [Pseudonocardiaceae bacterium]|nr:SGNH/GDSL hydrolase family protein [Pseudonocardiaceae bacterium]